MARIFISYRRRDSAGHAGRLYDGLVAEFGEAEVYRDVDKQLLGKRFDERITSELAGCDAFVAVIGPRWVSITDDSDRRRLDDPDDLVRREIAGALEREIPVFPVLVDRAEMPDEDELPAAIANLGLHEALELSDSRWGYDLGRLVEAIREALAAEVLAPHCRIVARALAENRLVPVIGSPGSSTDLFALPVLPWIDPGERIHGVLAALPAILRRKGYDPRLLIATSERGDALESAFREAGEEYAVAGEEEEALTWEIGVLYEPQPTTIVRLAPPSPALDRLFALAPRRTESLDSLPTQLSIRLWSNDVLFLGGSENDDGVAQVLARRRVLTQATAWVVGVPAIAGGFWEEAGVELVDAELPAYGRALRRQVEALPPAD